MESMRWIEHSHAIDMTAELIAVTPDAFSVLFTSRAYTMPQIHTYTESTDFDSHPSVCSTTVLAKTRKCEREAGPPTYDGVPVWQCGKDVMSWPYFGASSAGMLQLV